MLHIYTGDGKGKTTAAIGLSLRAAAAGKRVLFFQFLKSDTSGERKVLSQIKNITVFNIGENIPFLFNADEKKLSELKTLYKKKTDLFFEQKSRFDVFIFDEAVCALDCGLIEADDILRFTDFGEVVLTGRGNIDNLKEHAQYITCMKKIKHPYDSGISAREGIEY